MLFSRKKTPKKEKSFSSRRKASISSTSSTGSSGEENDIETDFPGLNILVSLEFEDVISELMNALEEFEQRLIPEEHDGNVEEKRMSQSASPFPGFIVGGKLRRNHLRSQVR